MTRQFLRQTIFNFEIWVTFGQCQIMSLTSDARFISLTHLFDCLYQLWGYDCSSFQIKHYFHLCPCKSLYDQIWPWRKIGQGQPSVIIWIILVVLTYTMLHTKFQVHWSWEDFSTFLPFRHGVLGHVTRTVWTTFRSSDHWRLYLKFSNNWPRCFRREVVGNCGWTTTDDNGRWSLPIL